MMIRNRWALAVLVCPAVGADVQSRELPQPQVELCFDQPDDPHHQGGVAAIQAEALGGAGISDAGAGPAGGDDRALDLSAPQGMGKNATGDFSTALDLGDVPGVDKLSAMTVVLWVRADEGSTPGQGARLADNGRDWLLMCDGPSRVRLEVAGKGDSSSSEAYPELETWTFIAVTYDRSDDTPGSVLYYRGTAEDAVEVVTRRERRDNYDQAMPGSRAALQLGNNGDGTRPFDGHLDGFRVYDAVLTAEQLESLRQSDLNVNSTSEDDS